jgi:hypothetical protein
MRFNSQRTLVDRNSFISANATVTGEGGRVIVWADQNTGYFGRITGRGATGRGAFVEISGRENLAFDGRVEIPGANGLFGSLLLDPLNVVISAATTDDAQITGDGIIGAAEAPGATWFISAGALNGIAGGTPISIEATNNIDFQAPIALTPGTGAVSFTASTITASAGAVILGTYGRNLTLTADIIDAANLDIDTYDATVRTGTLQATANNGNLRLGDLRTLNAIVNGGAITLTAPLGAITIVEIYSYSDGGNGGAINVTSQGNISTGVIYSGSINGGNGGVINVTSQGNIVINEISSQGSSPGNTSGAITINAGNLFRVLITGGGYCSTGSICSNGLVGAGDGAITIRHGGGITTPFTIGDASIQWHSRSN